MPPKKRKRTMNNNNDVNRNNSSCLNLLMQTEVLKETKKKDDEQGGIPRSKISCKGCKSEFSFNIELKNHLKAKKITCIKCNQVCDSKCKLIKHLNKHQQDTCKNCGLEVKTKKMEHRKIGKKLVCNICGVYAFSACNLQQHLNFYHPKQTEKIVPIDLNMVDRDALMETANLQAKNQTKGKFSQNKLVPNILKRGIKVERSEDFAMAEMSEPIVKEEARSKPFDKYFGLNLKIAGSISLQQESVQNRRNEVLERNEQIKGFLLDGNYNDTETPLSLIDVAPEPLVKPQTLIKERNQIYREQGVRSQAWRTRQMMKDVASASVPLVPSKTQRVVTRSRSHKGVMKELEFLPKKPLPLHMLDLPRKELENQVYKSSQFSLNQTASVSPPVGHERMHGLGGIENNHLYQDAACDNVVYGRFPQPGESEHELVLGI